MTNISYLRSCLCRRQRALYYRFLRLGARIVFAIGIFLALASCYVIRQSAYLSENNSRAVSIDELLQERSVTAQQREFLLLVKEVKAYATQVLGLKRDDSYTSYIEIDKPYLLDVVSACREVAFEPYTWLLPRIGVLPYRGYFDRTEALREFESLEQRGYDVLVRKVDAYSSLGYAADPVYSFMERYDIFEVASLIIHEQTHATLFFEGQIQLSEGLATFMGYKGALEFIRHKLGTDSPEYRDAQAFLRDFDVFRELIMELHCKLKDVYDSKRSRWRKLKSKHEIITGWKREYATRYRSKFDTDAFAGFKDVPLNNAHILAYRLYTQDLDFFAGLYEHNERSLKRMMQELQKLSQTRDDLRDYLANELLVWDESARDPAGRLAHPASNHSARYNTSEATGVRGPARRGPAR